MKCAGVVEKPGYIQNLINQWADWLHIAQTEFEPRKPYLVLTDFKTIFFRGQIFWVYE